ncbi:glycosyltransferase family 2 protein [Spirochaetota bacterium]
MKTDSGQEKHNSPVVGIIVPVKNRKDEITRLLASVDKQTYPLGSISVVIVDAFSTDGTAEEVKKHSFAKLLQIDEERHVSRNRGAESIESKYLIHLDSDMELLPGTIETLVSIAEKEGYEFLSIPERSEGKTLWAKSRNLEKIMIDDDPDRCGGRFMMRKVFNAVGGYDEDTMNSEDYNIHTRIIQAGYKHRVAKETFVYHHEKSTVFEAARKQFYYSQTAHLYMKKYPKAWVKQYNPLRLVYFTHIKLLLRHPFLTFILFAGKVLNYTFGLLGLLYGIIKGKKG